MNLKDYHIIISAGATKEWLDPVRYLTNPSSGEMGYRLGVKAKAYSNKVTYVKASVKEKFSRIEDVENISVESTKDMLSAISGLLEERCILLMAAAPLDYHFANTHNQKIKKGQDSLELTLKKNPDILMSLAELRKSKNLQNCYFFGFAAETQNILEYGQKKLKQKELEMIFINEVFKSSKGFGGGLNKYIALDKNLNQAELGPASKIDLAEQIWKAIENYLGLKI